LDDRRSQVLVLCPTRELCAQVARTFRQLGRHFPGLHVALLSGGAPIGPQLGALEAGAHILVGTPGRVLDHLRRGSIGLDALHGLVLDEADRLLAMGFSEDIEEILAKTPSARQLAFFSATFPPEVDAWSRRHQRNPVRVRLKEEPESRPAIRHRGVEVPGERQVEALASAVGEFDWEQALVFCNQKARAMELEREFRARGVSCAALQGDLEQRDRDRVLARFRNQSVRVLFATDVAARGIDVEGLELVVNLDLPPVDEQYVHRIGRTGRAGKSGTALTFFRPGRRADWERLVALSGIPAELQNADLNPAAVARGWERLSRPAPMETLYVSGGRKDKVRPGDLLGALTGEAGGLRGDQIGKIEVHDRFSYVAVERSVAAKAQQGLASGRIKGREFRVGWASGASAPRTPFDRKEADGRKARMHQLQKTQGRPAMRPVRGFGLPRVR
jgi:ATP-independent RNA helicase DbpA